MKDRSYRSGFFIVRKPVKLHNAKRVKSMDNTQFLNSQTAHASMINIIFDP